MTDGEITGILLVGLLVYFYLWIGIMMVAMDPAERPTRWRRWRRRLAMWLFWGVLWPYDSFRDWLAQRREEPPEPLTPLSVQEPRRLGTIRPTTPEPAPQAAPEAIDPQVIANVLKEIRDDAERKRTGS